MGEERSVSTLLKRQKGYRRYYVDLDLQRKRKVFSNLDTEGCCRYFIVILSLISLLSAHTLLFPFHFPSNPASVPPFPQNQKHLGPW